MGGKSPKTSTQHRRNADNTIKKTFAYFNKALFWRQPLSVTI
uniref:WW-binding domain and destruction box n=1 Tax=Siphoviridae sp. ct9zP9 TaxID=2827795 RepID=A0A8S5SGQ0_9CAUD|nr:MAG TPA: Putative WW-binding domain and destruction box [Caudoviricetes sp.]DAF50201.1 MAG TPA: Putative WW-binding domain and destruction box [Siphoviridae sp. ct9zP9]